MKNQVGWQAFFCWNRHFFREFCTFLSFLRDSGWRQIWGFGVGFVGWRILGFLGFEEVQKAVLRRLSIGLVSVLPRGRECRARLFFQSDFWRKRARDPRDWRAVFQSSISFGGGIVGGCFEGGRILRECKFPWLRCLRARAFLGLLSGRRRFPKGEWRSCGATCAE